MIYPHGYQYDYLVVLFMYPLHVHVAIFVRLGQASRIATIEFE